MILNYSNNIKMFMAKLLEVLSSIHIRLDKSVLNKLTSVKIYKVQGDDDGFVFFLKYKYSERLLNELQGDMISFKFKDSVSSIDVDKNYSNITTCLILNDLSEIEEITDSIYFKEADSINLVIETDRLESIEDIMVTQIFTDILLNSDILSLCSLYISNQDRVEKPAFYMYLAALCARFLDVDVTCQIYTDFDVDLKLLKEYITVLTKSTPTDRILENILVTNTN